MVEGRARFVGAAFALCLLIAVVTASSSTGAAQVCLRANGTGCTSPPISPTLSASVLPQRLPAGRPAPIGLEILMKLGIRDKRAPAVALREAELNVDKDVRIDVGGLPVCGYRKVASRDSAGARRACRRAIVGSGWASAQLARPELPPAQIRSRLIAFNGGFRDGAIRLFVHALAPPPLARPLVARIDVRRWSDSGRSSGWEVLAKLPKIGNGYGSLTAFWLNLERSFFHRGVRKSFLSARCSDGELRVSARRLEFRNEANIPGIAPRTVFKGDLTVPCKRKQ